MPSRLIAVPNGAAVAFGSGGNAGNGRIAPGAPARARNRPFGSTYAQPRAVAACPMVALYCATVPSMLSVSVTEITCVSEQSIVVGVPAAAAARRGASPQQEQLERVGGRRWRLRRRVVRVEQLEHVRAGERYVIQERRQRRAAQRARLVGAPRTETGGRAAEDERDRGRAAVETEARCVVDAWIEERRAHRPGEQHGIGEFLQRVVKPARLDSGGDAVPEGDVALEHRAARVGRDQRREQLVLMTRRGKREGQTGGEQVSGVRHRRGPLRTHSSATPRRGARGVRTRRRSFPWSPAG